MINYCLPVISPDWKKIDELLHERKADYRYFEVWLDYLDDCRVEQVQRLCEEWGERLLLLFRRQRLEPIRMAADLRGRIMEAAARYGSFVDIDIESQPEDLDRLGRCTLRPPSILSYHNYTETPAILQLRDLSARMIAASATICKVACFCSSAADALRLLEFQQELLVEGVRHIVLGMGRHGMVTRIFGTIWGNEMIFAPLEREAESAPGQLTRAELQRIFDVLGASMGSAPRG